MKEIEISKPIGKDLSHEEMLTAAARALGTAPKNVAVCRIVRRSIDARNDILYRYRIEAYAAGEEYREYELEEYKDVSSAEPVIIVGAGPAGMFAALSAGYTSTPIMRFFRPKTQWLTTLSEALESTPSSSILSMRHCHSPISVNAVTVL